MRIAIIGAGAAGSLCAIELKRRIPSAEVDVYEAGKKPLAKVAVTGGGRCNLTNSFQGIKSLAEAYPRGEKLMKRLFRNFGHEKALQWFENEGIKFILQDDHCYFPVSQDAMEIVNMLCLRMRQEGVRLHTGYRVDSIVRNGTEGYIISSEGKPDVTSEYVVVTTGGSPTKSGLDFAGPLGLETIPPVPSLFSFNIGDKSLKKLMGTVAENASVSIPGTRFTGSGPLLITHWGMSGPAILKLSSHAARFLADNGYKTRILVNWMGQTENDVRTFLAEAASANGRKQIANTHPEDIPGRLWEHILGKAGVRNDIRWSELGSKGLNRLVNTLLNDEYEVTGKSRFKEEFVTCGGVALSNINPSTLETKNSPGLYFAGEVLDVDAITGGFNLQAAWTMGYTVARAIEAKAEEGYSVLPG
ncbi:MAG: aminoacetone oxidase family FAD-binding enzyme [Candidatus Cryptobacteroides sp.]